MPWGYTIYRTVYTPESDIIFPRVVAGIEASLCESIFAPTVEGDLRGYARSKEGDSRI